MISDYFKLAYRNIKRRKLRSWLTMLGIFISIATIFMLISLSLGLQGAIEEQFRLLGTDKFFLQPSTGFLGPPGSIENVILTEDDVRTIEKVRGVKEVAYYTATNAKLKFNDVTRYNLVWGISFEGFDLFVETGQLNIDEGRFLEKGDSGIVIGNLYKTGDLFTRPVRAGDEIEINDQEVKVRGILALIGNPDDDSIVYMDLDNFREFFDVPDRVDWTVVQVEEGEDTVEVAERTEEKLRKTRGVTEKTQDFGILTPEELLGSVQDILGIVTAFLAGVAGIALVVGGIGIANTMYTSVLERTKEIGTMKAVGARNRDVLLIFVIESGLLGLVGAIIGIVLGYGISKGIEYIALTQLNTNLLQAAAPLYLVIGCLVFGFLIGAVSGVLPAIQASRTKVVDALRYE